MLGLGQGHCKAVNKNTIPLLIYTKFEIALLIVKITDNTHFLHSSRKPTEKSPGDLGVGSI